MDQDEFVTTPHGVAEEAGVWPPQPTIAPPVFAGPTFGSPVPLSRWVVTLLGIGIGFDTVEFLTEMIGAGAGGPVNALINLLASLVSLATTVCFLVWIYRVSKNLRAFGTQGLRFTPGWAVGYFFVPILNLYRPYQVFREIWRASEAAPAARVGQDWQFVRPPALLLGWWLSSLIANLVVFLNVTQPTSDGNEAADVLNVLSALLNILVVLRITARQTRTADAIIKTD